MALEQEGFKILNNITWRKNNPPPNLSCRYFTHSTETILWARKNDIHSKHFYNYELMKKYNNGKQMKDVWEGSLTPKFEKIYGKHPTQKPEYLLHRIIEASTKEGDLILDPFLGFRVIIMTQANSQVNTRVLELLPKFKIKKMNRWCAV